jgi:hypothetical protein
MLLYLRNILLVIVILKVLLVHINRWNHIIIRVIITRSSVIGLWIYWDLWLRDCELLISESVHTRYIIRILVDWI